jgi:hypothetical protein
MQRSLQQPQEQRRFILSTTCLPKWTTHTTLFEPAPSCLDGVLLGGVVKNVVCSSFQVLYIVY